MRKYFLLVRHGSVDHDPDKPDSEQGLTKGGEDIKQVASALAEHLRVQSEPDPILIGEIWCGSYRQVRETAGVLYETLRKNGLTIHLEQFRGCMALDPDQFWQARGQAQRHEVGRWLLEEWSPNGLQEYPEQVFSDSYLENSPNEMGECGKKANAVLVVGHAPQIGWTAEKLLRRPIPVARSELVCIAVSDSKLDRLLHRDRWLMWVISPSDTKATEELRDKIESKMNLAGLLGGLITGILGLLLGSLLDTKRVSALDVVFQVDMYISAGLFLIALGLYLATMYAYDRLLMPTRFWAEKAAPKERRWLVKRPPSSSTRVLYQNMIRVWNWLFTPATLAVIAGLLFLAHAVFHPDWVVVVGMAPLLLMFAWYYRHFRPTLGTED